MGPSWHRWCLMAPHCVQAGNTSAPVWVSLGFLEGNEWQARQILQRIVTWWKWWYNNDEITVVSKLCSSDSDKSLSVSLLQTLQSQVTPSTRATRACRDAWSSIYTHPSPKSTQGGPPDGRGTINSLPTMQSSTSALKAKGGSCRSISLKLKSTYR